MKHSLRKPLFIAGFTLAIVFILFVIFSMFFSEESNMLSRVEEEDITFEPLVEDPDTTITSEPIPTAVLDSSSGNFLKNSVYITNRSPANGDQNVPLDTEALAMELNQPVQSEDITLLITPEIDYTVEVRDTVIRFNFTSSLEGATVYSYSLFLDQNETPINGTFVTFGNVEQLYPETRSETLFEDERDFQQINNPDVFLSNNVPYSARTFFIEARLVTQPTERFVFDVEIKDPITGEEDMYEWIRSIGVTNSQIEQLEFNISN